MFSSFGCQLFHKMSKKCSCARYHTKPKWFILTILQYNFPSFVDFFLFELQPNVNLLTMISLPKLSVKIDAVNLSLALKI